MKQILKKLVPDHIYDELLETMDKYAISTPLRVAHFLSQCAHESRDFRRTEENLMYSEKILLLMFPKYFNKRNVSKYAYNPVNIASRVYANRMGNGSEDSKEGYKYRGRGYIQLTGKDNYMAFNKDVTEDIVENADLVASKYPLLSAGWFWNSRNINYTADNEGALQVTKLVNGGINGLEDRHNRFVFYIEKLK